MRVAPIWVAEQDMRIGEALASTFGPGIAGQEVLLMDAAGSDKTNGSGALPF